MFLRSVRTFQYTGHTSEYHHVDRKPSYVYRTHANKGRGFYLIDIFSVLHYGTFCQISFIFTIRNCTKLYITHLSWLRLPFKSVLYWHGQGNHFLTTPNAGQSKILSYLGLKYLLLTNVEGTYLLENSKKRYIKNFFLSFSVLPTRTFFN